LGALENSRVFFHSKQLHPVHYLLLIVVFSILSMSSVCSQQEAAPVFDKKFSHEIEQELKAGKLSHSSASYYFTYIGNYKKAIEHYALPLDWGLDTLTSADSMAFLNYRPVNAFDYLSERIADERIVIISEAHQMPQHRVFTAALLNILYENGFRHLGLETITPGSGDSTQFLRDTFLQERGYPLNSPLTGYYTREPQMGNLVREALRSGFTLFGYERTSKNTERDLQQAMNIKRYLQAHPNEKIVIHCGWYHAIESDFPKRKKDHYMAYHLKNLTGINPLTIYQDALSEKIAEEESPYYQMVQANEISVLVDDKGNVFNGKEGAQHVDILIYHPKTTYSKNRPNWLFQADGKQYVPVETYRISHITYPLIVEAIPIGEEHSVPVDVIELQDAADETGLVLKKGGYTIRLTDAQRKVQEYRIRME
jgi:hypothetical protein